MLSMSPAAIESPKLITIDDPRLRIIFAGVLIVVGIVIIYLATTESFILSTRVALILGYVVGIPLLLSANYDRSIMLMFAFASVAGLLKYKTGFNPIIHVTIDIMMGLICLGWLIRHMFRSNRQGLARAPMGKLIGVFIFLCVIQIFNPLGYSYFASVASLKMHIFMIPLFFFGYHYFNDVGQFRRYAVYFAVIGLVMSAFSVDQYQKGPEQMKEEMPEYATMIDYNTWQDAEGVSYFRPMSTTSNPGGAAGWMQCFIPVILVVFMFKRISRRTKLFLGFTLMVLAGTLFISLIRQMMMVTIGSLVLILLMQFMSGKISRGILSLAAVVILIGGGWQMANGIAKGDILQGNVLEILSNPLKSYMDNRGAHLTYMNLTAEGYPLGAGLGRTGPASVKFRTEMWEYREKFGGPLGMSGENYFLVMISETGIPGTFVITLIAMLLLVRGLKIYLTVQDDDLKWAAIACWGILLSIFVVFFGGPALVTPPLNLFFWFLGGVLLKIPVLDSQLSENVQEEPVEGAVLSQSPS